MNPEVRRERKNMAGHRFGRLTALAVAPKNHKELHWDCVCDCGSRVVVRGSSLRNGHTISCGVRCTLRQMPSQRTHGQSRTPTWNSWSSMRKRCENPAEPKFPQYGGRGISVCERWQVFESFLADMGARPIGTTLDRWPDTNGNYEPGNCRWATPTEQQNNRTNNRRIDVNGDTMTIAQLSAATGMSPSAIARRLARGGEFDTPIGVAHEAG